MRRTVEAMLVPACWSIWSTPRGLVASEHARAHDRFENASSLADLVAVDQ